MGNEAFRQYLKPWQIHSGIYQLFMICLLIFAFHPPYPYFPILKCMGWAALCSRRSNTQMYGSVYVVVELLL